MRVLSIDGYYAELGALASRMIPCGAARYDDQPDGEDGQWEVEPHDAVPGERPVLEEDRDATTHARDPHPEVEVARPAGEDRVRVLVHERGDPDTEHLEDVTGEDHHEDELAQVVEHPHGVSGKLAAEGGRQPEHAAEHEEDLQQYGAAELDQCQHREAAMAGSFHARDVAAERGPEREE